MAEIGCCVQADDVVWCWRGTFSIPSMCLAVGHWCAPLPFVLVHNSYILLHPTMHWSAYHLDKHYVWKCHFIWTDKMQTHQVVAGRCWNNFVKLIVIDACKPGYLLYTYDYSIGNNWIFGFDLTLKWPRSHHQSPNFWSVCAFAQTLIFISLKSSFKG